jgi:hypothetical protein
MRARNPTLITQRSKVQILPPQPLFSISCEPPKRLSPDPPALTPTYLSRRSAFCRPGELTICRSMATMRPGSPDSSDPQARNLRCHLRGARRSCRKKLESRFASMYAAVQLWSFPWHQPVPPHSCLRRKRPHTSAFRFPRFGGGAAIRPDRNISASAAFCAPAAPRSTISSQGIQEPHSEAHHGT